MIMIIKNKSGMIVYSFLLLLVTTCYYYSITLLLLPTTYNLLTNTIKYITVSARIVV